MMGGASFTAWSHEAAAAAREWVEFAASDAALLNEPELLPQLDLAALVDPMRGSVIEIPTPVEVPPATERVQIRDRNRAEANRPNRDATVTRPASAFGDGVTHSEPAAYMPSPDPVVLGRTVEAVIERVSNLTISPAPEDVQTFWKHEATKHHSESSAVIREILAGKTTIFENFKESVERQVETWIHQVEIETPMESILSPVVTTGTVSMSETKIDNIRLEEIAERVIHNASHSESVVESHSAATETLTHTIEHLVQVVNQLDVHHSVNQHSTQTAVASANTVMNGGSEAEQRTIRWLEDDDLTARLQNILRRQARRRGIDLS